MFWMRWFIIKLSCGCTFTNSQARPIGAKRWCDKHKEYVTIEECDPYEADTNG